MCTAARYKNRRARNGRPANASNEGRRLSSHLADANCIGLASNTSVAYLDIVTSDGQVEACIIAQRDVERTGCVVTHRVLTIGCVVAPACVAIERTLTAAGVEITDCIAKER